MSNLSDLLPAGGGAKVITATASGNLATGQTVILQSDGTVKVVEQTTISEGKGSATTFESGSTAYTAAAYDTNKNKVLVVYRDTSDSVQGKAVVGTVNGTSITFTTPKVFRNSSGGAGANYIALAFDSTRNNFAVVFAASYLNRLQGKVLTIQDDGTVNDGSFTTIVNNEVSRVAISYSPTQDKFLVSYRDHNSSNYGRNLTLTSNGNTFSVGTPNTFTSNPVEFIDNVYVVGYKRSATPYVMSCYISGTQVVNQAEYQLATANGDQTMVGYDAAADRYVAVYRDEADSDKAALKSFAVTTSASAGASTITSVSSEVHANSSASTDYALAYDSNVQKLSLFYNEGTKAYVRKITDSTQSGLAVGDAFELTPATSPRQTSAVYDPDSKNFVYSYAATSSGSIGRGIVYQPTYAVTNSADFVGITNQAINNSASGEVVVEGGAITNGSLLPSVASSTFGSEVVFENSESAYEAIVYDTANDKVVVAYKDTADSQKGKAVVGTVSGTTISFGTPVNFEGSDSTTYVKAAYDPDQGKVIITWNSNSTGHHKAIVGTVSGTTISFGSPVTYEASAGVNFGIVYDTSNDKAVLTFKDGSNSNYGTAIVGTVSGTSISFGTKAVIKSQNLFQVGSVFDSTNNKVLISYTQDLGGASSDTSELVVGTVSGTSISFGTALQFLAGQAYNQSLAHDTSSGKNVLVYRDINNSSYGTAVVATISGTSVSIGTAVVFNAATTQASNVMYDPTTNATFVFYKDGGNSDYGTAKGGIISGTDIAFGSASIFNAANPGGTISSVKDPDQNKAVIAYVDYGNNQYGTAVVGTLTSSVPALTTGSTYYVQDDGTLSTTSSSVTAGKAIANTTLLLKG
jgi:hypothetical protein